MEKERLVIKNFGPIKSVDLDLGKMTILIGDQATGKSTIAKVLAVCRYFSYIVNYKDFEHKISSQDTFKDNNQFLKGLSDWGIIGYIKPNSYIKYNSSLYNFEFDALLDEIIDNETFIFNTKTRLEPFGNFKKLLKELEDLREAEMSLISDDNPKENWTPNENFYRLNVKKVMDNPFYIPTERALQTNSYGKDLLISDAQIDELNKINRILRSAKKEWHIDHLSVSYKNIDGQGFVKKSNEDLYFPLNYGASGYQSSIPITLIIQYHNVYLRSRTFIIEEPELNLFPKTQKNLIEFFVESINNNGHSFLIPTHSPYVLSSLNNLMVAYRVGQKQKEKVIKELKIEEKYWLNPKDISAYGLEYDEKEGGIIHKDLFLKDLQEISLDYLDGVSSEINDTWDKLIELEGNED